MGAGVVVLASLKRVFATLLWVILFYYCNNANAFLSVFSFSLQKFVSQPLLVLTIPSYLTFFFAYCSCVSRARWSFLVGGFYGFIRRSGFLLSHWFSSPRFSLCGLLGFANLGSELAAPTDLVSTSALREGIISNTGDSVFVSSISG